MKLRRLVRVQVVLSIAPGVSIGEARRELRTRCNEGCCHSREQGEVRVAKFEPVVKGEKQ